MAVDGRRTRAGPAVAHQERADQSLSPARTLCALANAPDLV